MINKSRFAATARRWFADGENVVAKASPLIGTDITQQDAIEVAYDLQTGSYVAALADPAYGTLKRQWGERLAEVLQGLGAASVCEAGIGEATTLVPVIEAASAGITFAGFDLSLSRLLQARTHAGSRGLALPLFCADLLRIPLPDSAVDVVLTNHAIEPNGGQEAPILQELLRVSARFLVLVEPDYQRAEPAQQARMRQHNYVRDLPQHLQALPGRLVRDEPWPFAANPLNRASLLVFEKAGGRPAAATLDLVAPLTKAPLTAMGSFLYCAEEGLLYPVPFGIPVLRDDCAIVCSQAERLAGDPPGATGSDASHRHNLPRH